MRTCQWGPLSPQPQCTRPVDIQTTHSPHKIHWKFLGTRWNCHWIRLAISQETSQLRIFHQHMRTCLVQPGFEIEVKMKMTAQMTLWKWIILQRKLNLARNVTQTEYHFPLTWINKNRSTANHMLIFTTNFSKRSAETDTTLSWCVIWYFLQAK